MKQQKHASRVVGGTNLNNVTDPITRTVKAMSSANGSIHSSMNSFASAAKNPKQFPKMVVAVTLASGLVGFAVMQIVDHKRERNIQKFSKADQGGSNEIKKEMSHNQSLVLAMVENAKSSSLSENLENAAIAQKNFMVVPFDKSVADDEQDQEFLQKLARKGEEIRSRNKTE